MDIDKILQKLTEWLSDPKGREMVKTFFYLIFPLIVIIALRNAARRRPTEKEVSSAFAPKLRPHSSENLLATETVKETMAKERKKIQSELQEVFGREKRSLKKTRKNLARPEISPKAPPAEASQSGEKGMLPEDLLRLFSRRPK